MKIPTKRSNGFTLIELLVVVSIIGVLASIILVAVQGARQKGVQAAALEFETTNYHSYGASAYFYANFNNQSTTAVDGAGNYPWTYTSSNLPTPAFVADSPSGGGYSLSLTNGSTLTAALSSGSIPMGPLTVSIWIKLNAPFSAGIQYLIQAPSSTGSGGCGANCIFIRKTGPAASASMQFGSNSYYVGSVPAPAIGNWTNYTYSWNGSTITVYMNGVVQNAPVISGNTVTSDSWGNNGGVTIGIGSGTATAYVDNVAIYSQSLSAAQVHDLYAMEAPAHGIAVK